MYACLYVHEDNHMQISEQFYEQYAAHTKNQKLCEPYIYHFQHNMVIHAALISDLSTWCNAILLSAFCCKPRLFPMIYGWRNLHFVSLADKTTYYECHTNSNTASKMLWNVWTEWFYSYHWDFVLTILWRMLLPSNLGFLITWTFQEVQFRNNWHVADMWF